MTHVPGATRALRVLPFVARQRHPVPLERIAFALDLPRSTAYQLVNAMIAEGLVVHLEDERRYGLGVTAFEVGTGYSRQEPVPRLARKPLTGWWIARLPVPTSQSSTVATSCTSLRSVPPGARPWSPMWEYGFRRTSPRAVAPSLPPFPLLS